MLSSLTFHHSFTCILSYKTPIEVILIALERLLKDLQSLFLPPRPNFNYSDRYKAWKCVKKVSTVRQARYSVLPCAITQPRRQQFADSAKTQEEGSVDYKRQHLRSKNRSLDTSKHLPRQKTSSKEIEGEDLKVPEQKL